MNDNTHYVPPIPISEPYRTPTDDYCDCGQRCPTCGKKLRPWRPYYPYPVEPYYPPYGPVVTW